MVLPFTAAAAAAAPDTDAATLVSPAPAAAATTAGRTIQEGDLVIVYESFQSMKHIYVDPKAQFQNRYGAFNQKVGEEQLLLMLLRQTLLLMLLQPQPQASVDRSAECTC